MPDFEELARHRGVPEVLAVVAALVAGSLLVATLTHSFRGLLLGAPTAWLVVAPREEPEEEEVTPEEAAEELRLRTEDERRRLLLDNIRARAGRL